MSTLGYQYVSADCDVEDKSALNTFRQKRSEWLDWLNHDEHHAITATISSMVWSDVSFRTLARAGEINENGALGNSLIMEGLIDGYFAVQTLSIRRLMEDSRKGRISLVNLLKDIKQRIGLFTRENFVCFDGLPYDYQAAQQRVLAARMSPGGGMFWAPRHGPDAFRPAEQAHKLFDRLSGVAPASRRRGDRLPKRYVETLQHWLEQSEAGSVVDWTHKYLAHAADRHSRGTADLTDIHPNLQKITSVIRTFIRVSQGALYLFGSAHGMVMPIPQFNQFAHLDASVVAMDQLLDIRMRWAEMGEDHNQSACGVIDELLSLTLGANSP